MQPGRVASGLVHGVRTSLRNNVTAYGFSVMITASFGVISAELGSPSVAQVFLFVGGAVTMVTALDAITSKGFKVKMRGDPADVVALGAAFSYFSVGFAVGAAALTAVIVHQYLAWPLGSAVACFFYILLSGLEMAAARVVQEDREEEDEGGEEEEASRGASKN